jgi:hypothetical protein
MKRDRLNRLIALDRHLLDQIRVAEAQRDTRTDFRKRREAHMRRNQRTQQLIRLGGNALIAGLIDMDATAIEGALRRAKDMLGAVSRRKWRRLGEIAMIEWEEGGQAASAARDIEPVPGRDAKSAAKYRNHRLATLGGAVVAAGWKDEDPIVLLGVLVEIAPYRAEPRFIESWKNSVPRKFPSDGEIGPGEKATKPEKAWKRRSPPVPAGGA